MSTKYKIWLVKTGGNLLSQSSYIIVKNLYKEKYATGIDLYQADAVRDKLASKSEAAFWLDMLLGEWEKAENPPGYSISPDPLNKTYIVVNTPSYGTMNGMTYQLAELWPITKTIQ